MSAKKKLPFTLFVNQILLLFLGISLFLPGEKQVKSPYPMVMAVLIF